MAPVDRRLFCWEATQERCSGSAIYRIRPRFTVTRQTQPLHHTGFQGHCNCCGVGQPPRSGTRAVDWYAHAMPPLGTFPWRFVLHGMLVLALLSQTMAGIGALRHAPNATQPPAQAQAVAPESEPPCHASIAPHAATIAGPEDPRLDHATCCQFGLDAYCAWACTLAVAPLPLITWATSPVMPAAQPGYPAISGESIVLPVPQRPPSA